MFAVIISATFNPGTSERPACSGIASVFCALWRFFRNHLKVLKIMTMTLCKASLPIRCHFSTTRQSLRSGMESWERSLSPALYPEMLISTSHTTLRSVFRFLFDKTNFCCLFSLPLTSFSHIKKMGWHALIKVDITPADYKHQLPFHYHHHHLCHILYLVIRRQLGRSHLVSVWFLGSNLTFLCQSNCAHFLKVFGRKWGNRYKGLRIVPRI